ncbi:Phosphoinositide 3-kinase adapter protein 1 [Labeo rohita]|uniref:Phosphoinositide 3-kinase adapter protein 1 n=1 Tax=Labeo rohita TaxID=84645 RepID=A0ABQ8M573_LABRO|nr:Phosphoinositide 3-kinase adapter protein 1 [Labeo rohita]
MCEVLIVYASEAIEWAEYLLQILAASGNFLEGSVILCDVNEQIWMKNHELVGSSKCIMLLLSAALLDMQHDPEVQDTFRDLLQPPCKIVAFLCGISEWQVSTDYFEHWEHWRKLNSEDEPSVYVSTVLECIRSGSVNENHCENPYEIELEEEMNEFTLSEIPETLPDETEQTQVNGDNVCQTEQTSSNVMEPQNDQICLTVQPDRILCGTHVNIYIIMAKKIVDEGRLEVEFHSQYSIPQRVPGTLVNEYIVTVQSPDMPAGKVSLTLYKNESVVYSATLTYYTEMEEICRYLKKAMDPMQFMCQAFDITSKVTESLDNLLANSLEERMPLNGLQVFGISQIADNTPANHRNVELPTLLHFSAKYGLKKLTSLLMRCPGAMQAYSVMNKDGDYPNNLAEKSGFSNLRQFMDEYVETVDLGNIEESQNTSGTEEIYEDMFKASQDFITNFENEDIYESMRQLNPEIDDDLENALEDSNSETILRKFFEAQPDKSLQSLEHTSTNGQLPEMDDEDYHDLHADIYGDIEEDPYNPCSPDEIYDTVEPQSTPEIINRPPAPIPRPANLPEAEENTTYISKEPVRLVRDRDMSSNHDPFAGMKTPGQRQLISLQERVKVGELTVEEAENLQRLRDSITRRCKGKGTNELMITAPMQTNVQWGSQMNVNCSVYEPTPRSIAQPPPVSRPLQRGSWQTGSTSSTSSSSSHRLSIQSTEPPDIPLPPRPLRPVVDTPPVLPPPRVPPRVIERTQEMSNERYVPTPARPVHQTPAQRPIPPPPIPRRTW